jgi:RNA polymerase sigma-70 factor (ECF subfamily)
VLAAGATGAIGRPLVPALVAAGHEVIATTRSPARQAGLAAAGAEPVVLDGLDAVAVGEAVGKAEPEVIIHEMPDHAEPEQPGPDSTQEAYADLRPLMFAIAYRMLGRVTEAEDIVQEAFLRYHRALADGARPDSPKAYLSAVTTRLCIDQARSARARREAYVGEWLPEPLLTGPAGRAGPVSPAGPSADPAELAERSDSLSMAFLLLLERLSPVERAVFLLHDVFSYGYDETARIVGKSEGNCRQLAHRARQHVSEHRPRYEPSPDHRAELASRFFAAIDDGDLDGLVSMLAADVTVHGDSGGMRPSWPRPITGRDKVSRLLVALAAQSRAAGAAFVPAQVNGQPGVLVRDRDENLVSVLVLDIAAGQVVTVRSVISRDKLRHLGPLADVSGLIREFRQAAARDGDRG